MINPQTINPLTLPSVALNERSQLPSQPCIYFAIDSQGMVQYIGRSDKFWQITGLPRATAFRLWRDRDIYPDRTTVSGDKSLRFFFADVYLAQSSEAIALWEQREKVRLGFNSQKRIARFSIKTVT